MFCKKCGRQLEDNATFCTSCGWKTDNWQRNVKQGKEMHTAIIVASILLLAVLIIFITHILNLVTI